MSVGCVEELRVESLAFGGDGVAHRADGQVVFVRRSAPGDRLLARIERDRGSYAHATPVRLLEGGLERREPECGYYERCGGCQLQHISIEGQREAKRVAVRDALRRIGGLDVAVPPLLFAGEPFGYRNRVTFTLRRRDGRVSAGYRRAGDPSAVTDVAECPLAEPAVREAWARLRAGWGQRAEALPAGEELRVTTRASAAGQVSVFIDGGRPGRPGVPGVVAGAVGASCAYHWRPDDGPRVLLAGETRFVDTWRGFEFALGPESFLQVNRAVGALMEDWIDARLGDLSGVRILDLYAGVGARALAWASAGADVGACEVDEEAVESGLASATRNGLDPDMRTGTVEARLPELLPAQAIVVNPPRRGLASSVADRLAECGARSLVYVSCDPGTLARDLKRLGHRWTVDEVQPFDAFPNTFHVETVAVLRSTNGDPA